MAGAAISRARVLAVAAKVFNMSFSSAFAVRCGHVCLALHANRAP
jgi:hypothetical protein